jgi:hypothetical protein
MDGMSGKSNSPRGERTVKGKIEQQVRSAEEKARAAEKATQQK